MRYFATIACVLFAAAFVQGAPVAFGCNGDTCGNCDGPNCSGGGYVTSYAQPATATITKYITQPTQSTIYAPTAVVIQQPTVAQQIHSRPAQVTTNVVSQPSLYSTTLARPTTTMVSQPNVVSKPSYATTVSIPTTTMVSQPSYRTTTVSKPTSTIFSQPSYTRTVSRPTTTVISQPSYTTTISRPTTTVVQGTSVISPSIYGQPSYQYTGASSAYVPQPSTMISRPEITTTTVVTQPTETIISQPTETIVSEPTAVVSQPITETIVSQPTETILSQTTDTIVSQPTTVVSEPIASVVSQPTNAVISQPLVSASVTTASSVMASQPQYYDNGFDGDCLENCD